MTNVNHNFYSLFKPYFDVTSSKKVIKTSLSSFQEELGAPSQLPEHPEISLLQHHLALNIYYFFYLKKFIFENIKV